MSKPKIDLVLSMGGARGLAHIGVIRELLGQGFEISSVTGSSMGALVGAMYATGTMEECGRWFSRWTRRFMWHMADFSFNSKGLIKGERFMEELSRIMPDMNIEDLPVPYKALATDVAHECDVQFCSGSLHKAVRASISIPFLFCPVRIGDCVLVDGGILNPLPIGQAIRTEGSLLMAVDVNASAGSVCCKMNIYNLLVRSSRMMMQRISSYQLVDIQPDIMVSIPASRYDMMDFHRASEIIAGGELAVRQTLDSDRLSTNGIPQ